MANYKSSYQKLKEENETLKDYLLEANRKNKIYFKALKEIKENLAEIYDEIYEKTAQGAFDIQKTYDKIARIIFRMEML